MPTIGVSLPIPQPYAKELQECRRSFGDPLADAIPTHVTLLPPTDVATEAMPSVHAHLASAAAAARPVDMIRRGTGTFRPVSPVVFVQVARGIPACERLEHAVRSGPLDRELSFPYHPHVTVAHGVPDEALDRAFDELATYSCSFDVHGFDLYEHGVDLVWRSVATYDFGVAAAEH
jgi:2'-5' RNA ligase